MSNPTSTKQQNQVGKTPTFAVMLDGVDGPYQLGVLSGMVQTAEEAHANLLCFVGGHSFGRDSSDARSRVYELINSHVADGIVVLASTLIHTVGRAGLADYCRITFGTMPICSVGAELPSVPAITIDNERGVRALVGHLASEHGYRRIAFVRGPPVNDEAELRFCAYRAALKEFRVTYDQKLVVDGDFMPASGTEAVRKLALVTNARLEGIECIMAANDAMAVGVLDALEERGIAVPRCIAVTGFDDSEDARLAPPPLSTVRQPLETMGKHAIQQLLGGRNPGGTARESHLSTELVVRRSCGCAGARLSANVPEPAPIADTTQSAQRQQALDLLTRAARGMLSSAGPGWQGRLINAVLADVGSQTGMTFVNLVNEMVDKAVSQGGPVDPYADVIFALRRQVLGTLRTDAVRREYADELFHAAHGAVCEAAHRALSRDRLKLGRGAQKTQSICSALAACFQPSELRACLQQSLPRLGIESYFVVLYRRGPGPQHAELLVACERGSRPKPGPSISFAGSTILPVEWMGAISKGQAFVVIPLAWKQELFGHIVLELHLDCAFAYVPIAEAITTALRGARLTTSPRLSAGDCTPEVPAQPATHQAPAPLALSSLARRSRRISRDSYRP